MDDPKMPSGIEEENLRRIVSAAMLPAAPPLPAGLPARLADRARGGSLFRIDLPLAAAGCSIAGLVFLAALFLLPAGRTDYRWWAAALPAVNLALSPFAAYVVFRNWKGEESHAKT